MLQQLATQYHVHLLSLGRTLTTAAAIMVCVLGSEGRERVEVGR
jgi:hypothetical protein